MNLFTTSPAFLDALQCAALWHGGQLRKIRNTPYFGHLLATCSHVLRAGGTEEEAIAALLHDVVEDAGGLPRLAEIESRFGGRVAKIVELCTDTHEEPKPAWRPRKEQFLASLAQADGAVQIVVAGDKLDNLLCIAADFAILGEGIWSHFRGGKEQTLWYYRSVIEVIQNGNDQRAQGLAAEMSWLVQQHGW